MQSCKEKVMVSMAMHVTWPGAVFQGRLRTWLCNKRWRLTAHCSWPGSTLAARLLHVARKPKTHTATERPPSRACHTPRTLHYAESINTSLCAQSQRHKLESESQARERGTAGSHQIQV